MIDLRKNASERTLFPENVNGLISKEEGLIVYGAGFNGIRCIMSLKSMGYNVLFACDADEKKHGKSTCGVMITSIEELDKVDNLTKIIISPSSFSIQITDKLNELGFNNIFYFSHGSALNAIVKRAIWDGPAPSECRIKRDSSVDVINHVREMLSDDKSKAIYDAVINARIYEDYASLEKWQEGDQYFLSELITLCDDEVFVDCGAAHGDTVDEFVAKTKGRYKHIYAFEPGDCFFEMMKSLISMRKYNNIDIYRYGVAEKSGSVHFSSSIDNPGSSSITKNGTTTINVTSLDDALFGLPDSPTFIKMDIEGSELNALKGAQRIIKRCVPKLAICVYHKFEDLWEIPYYIMSLCPEYRIYLRHHASINETVCYAIK